MHILFIPYGKRDEVELLLRDMEAQKHRLLLTKGKQKKYIWIQSQVRQLPLGIYEYICPKEDVKSVLETLNFYQDCYNLGKVRLSILRKIFKVESIPKKERIKAYKYLWIHENVNIIPIGIREDGEVINANIHKGWKHEAI